MNPRMALPALLALLVPMLSASSVRGQEEPDPPEVAIGERLFLETRFAQHFAAHSDGNVNHDLPSGDPAVDTTLTVGAPLPGPFAGRSMNCRSCHLVDEHHDAAGNRTYGDFARRSPIPDRGDGHTTTPRNSPPLVGASLARRGGFFLHFDAEFPSDEALVKGTFTGRNFGWLPNEGDQAVAHIAKVLREDDGSGELAQEFGGAYPVVLAGTDPSIPDDFRLPRRYRIDVTRASDAELLDAAARLVSVYLRQLTFAADARGRHNASPYDVFLPKNYLPTKPHTGESAAAYTRRLTEVLAHLTAPSYVGSDDGAFADHSQPFVFTATELAGMRLFFGPANCAACHPAPDFTDFGFHSTGFAEVEYDAVHGAGAFAGLSIPDRTARDADPAAYLPPSAAHPTATGRFRAVPAIDDPRLTDLGLWNIYGNADVLSRKQQKQLDRAVCRSLGKKARSCARGAALADTIGLFKTPGLRDLADSAPYLHTGSKDTIEDVLAFYMDVSARARAGTLRNADPQLARVTLTAGDLAPLAAFVRALDEDYE